MDEQPTHYLIPASLLQATLDYLARRPFVEVADAILALRDLEAHAPGDSGPRIEMGCPLGVRRP